MPGDRKDPFRGYNFKLELDGITRAGFRECTGLDADQAPIEYREGDEKVFTSRKLAGLVKYSNIGLKWGITDDHELWDWKKKFIDGKGTFKDRKNGSIVLMDESGEEKLRWNFVNAWPTNWKGPSFNATANEVGIESLDIAHEGVDKKK
jgi:phage tail-like protein